MKNDYVPSPEGATSALCQDTQDVRILRRVSSLDAFPCAPKSHLPVRTIAVVDVETTGLDSSRDEVFDIAVALIRVDAAGAINQISGVAHGLRDPGRPIPDLITRLTGITNADVAGRYLDLARIGQLIASADICLAHNAAFDAPFVERLLPEIAGMPWACSMRDMDWLACGFDGAKLGHLLMQAGYFNTAHRAIADVISLLHLLAHPLVEGTIIGAILDRAKRQSFRVEARGAPFDKRHALKARGYRWNPAIRSWFTELPDDALEDEQYWLAREIMAWGAEPHVTPLSWCERHR